MNKIDWKRKLTSRKLWLAIAGFASGLIIAFGGSESTASTVSGCIMSGAAVVGYMIGEGLSDSVVQDDLYTKLNKSREFSTLISLYGRSATDSKGDTNDK